MKTQIEKLTEHADHPKAMKLKQKHQFQFDKTPFKAGIVRYLRGRKMVGYSQLISGLTEGEFAQWLKLS